MHLFFDCVVAKQMWVHISEVVETNCAADFESIGKLWLSKRYMVVSMFASAALWGLWELRNFICFQNGSGEIYRLCSKKWLGRFTTGVSSVQQRRGKN